MAASVISEGGCENLTLAAAKSAIGRNYEEGVDFRIVRRESGSERSDLPIFTATTGAISFTEAGKAPVWREDFPEIPGAFLLHNVLTDAECDQIIAASEAMGYTEDAPVSLGRHIRKNQNCVWIADETMTSLPFERCRPHLPKAVAGGAPVGLNARWRLYKYNESDVFKPHTDGSWPGSGIDTSGNLQQDMFGDRWSQLTWALYLNDDFDGGSTRFYIGTGKESQYVLHDVPAKRGAALCFFHGEHPLSPLHEGALVAKGTKYIIRSDILYSLGGKL